MKRAAHRLLALAAAAGLAGCGLNIQSADLFLLTRTGQGPRLTLLINNSGTISCDGAKPKRISDPLLIRARDLADSLIDDAGNNLTIPRTAGSVYLFRIRMQQGTISFPDRAGARHKELAQAELFAAQTAQQACGLTG